jgi:hypothetical protein
VQFYCSSNSPEATFSCAHSSPRVDVFGFYGLSLEGFVSQLGRICIKRSISIGISVLAAVSFAFVIAAGLAFPVASAAQSSGAVVSKTPKPVIVEWVYRVKYGYKEE